MNDARLNDALTNEALYISQLIEMPDRTLAKKLNIIRQQMQTACEKKLTAALETLSIWERQIIEARYLKNDLEDEPVRKKAVLKEAGKTEEIIPASARAATSTATQLVLFS